MAARLAFLLLFFSSWCFSETLEKRVYSLSSELRCLVCQNQSLADSNAPLALDLKNQIREQLAAGKSEPEVKAWLVERYGDFVLYRPPFKAGTLLLWAGPFVVLVLAALFLARRVRRRGAPPELAPGERERAARLLE